MQSDAAKLAAKWEVTGLLEGLAWPDYLSVVVELDEEGRVIFT